MKHKAEWERKQGHLDRSLETSRFLLDSSETYIRAGGILIHTLSGMAVRGIGIESFRFQLREGLPNEKKKQVYEYLRTRRGFNIDWRRVLSAEAYSVTRTLTENKGRLWTDKEGDVSPYAGVEKFVVNWLSPPDYTLYLFKKAMKDGYELSKKPVTELPEESVQPPKESMLGLIWDHPTAPLSQYIVDHLKTQYTDVYRDEAERQTKLNCLLVHLRSELDSYDLKPLPEEYKTNLLTGESLTPNCVNDWDKLKND